MTDAARALHSPSGAIARGLPSVLAWVLVPVFGLLSLLRGRDVSWDFRNYHWYNPYAWLNDRSGIDMAVAHHATYYNPLADVPVFVAAQYAPTWLVGFAIGCVHGLNLVLLYWLARAATGAQSASREDWIAFAIAVIGTTGGMALILVGNSSNDMTMTLFVLAALLLLVRTGGAADNSWRFVAAGLVCGMAVGLKLTMAPFAIGLAAGVLALAAPLRVRLKRLVLLGLGGVSGAALFGGAWGYTLWQQTGNPIFPYFNHVIGSPLILDASYRDERFLPHGFLETLMYPLVFSLDGMRVNDIPFRDIKIAMAYAIVPMAVTWTVLKRRALTQPARLLFVSALVSYLVWMSMFGVYRYVLSLEMLAPLLVVMALALLPLSGRTRSATLVVLALLAIVFTGWRWLASEHVGWSGGYVDATLPQIDDPDRTLVVLAGLEPMGYLVPAFPSQIPFLRIDGWLDSPSSHSAFGDRMRARIDAHEGPIFGMFIERERERAVAAFGADGLMLANADCATIHSNIGEPLHWCALQRKASSNE